MRGPARWRSRVAPSLASLLVLATAPAHGQRIELGVDAIEHPVISARRIRLSVDALSGGTARLRVASIRVASRRFADVILDCPAYAWERGRIECRRGTLMSAGQKTPLPLRFAYTPATQALELALEPQARERWSLRVTRDGQARRADLTLENADLARLAAWVPQLASINAKGRASGTLAWQGSAAEGRAQGTLRLAEGAFSDASGTRAAERLGATLTLAADQQGERWSWRASLDWDKGEGYWQPWYLADGGVQMKLAGTLDPAAVRIDDGQVTLRRIGDVRFTGELARDGWQLAQASFESGAIDLTAAAPLLVAPLLESGGAPKLELSGSVRAKGTLASGRLQALDVDLKEVAVSEANRRFGVSGMSGPLAWRSDAPVQGVLHVGSAFFGKLPLDSFDLPYHAQGLSFAVPRIEIPVLDGRLVVDGLEAAQSDGRWRWQLGGALQPISMARLTEAFGLPRMAGTLSASIPHIRDDGSTITLDGALIIQVFDGYLSATDLKLVEPLGLVPRLYGTLDMRHIDLGQLTETFSFGSITGYIDGYVKDMELADWRPQRFDALVISSPGDYPRRISQRAVQNISALGGAGAAAAIQRSFLGFFKQFGYSKLGLSCSLRQGVCEMGGVDEAPQGYVIVKGGGVPAITVMGYNRRVDWDELLSRLKRVTETNTKPIVR
jgi:hypothetical protein